MSHFTEPTCICRTLTFAAVDTTSGALARTLHILSEHPEVQAKVRAEIRIAKEKFGGDLPYDELVSLPYLDAVCRETLRLYVFIFSRSQISIDLLRSMYHLGILLFRTSLGRKGLLAILSNPCLAFDKEPARIQCSRSRTQFGA